MFQIGQWEIFEAGSCVLLLIILWTHSYLLAKLRIPGSFCTFPALVWHSAIYPSSGSLNREWYSETKIWASVRSSLQESHHFQALSAEKAAWCLQVHTHTHTHTRSQIPTCHLPNHLENQMFILIPPPPIPIQYSKIYSGLPFQIGKPFL